MIGFKQFLIEQYRGSFFHGCDERAFKFNLENGIQYDPGEAWSPGQVINSGVKAVYFTGSIETAARYAVGVAYNSEPFIIEFYLSGKSKFKKMKFDPMDRPDYDNEFRFGDDDLFQLSSSVEKLYRDLTGDSSAFKFVKDIKLSGFEELDEIRGFKLHQNMINVLTRKLGRSRKQEIKREIMKRFEPGQFSEYLEITRSGTIALNDDYYQHIKQVQMTTQKIPPSAFKFVWVRTADHPRLRDSDIIETDNFGEEELPHESQDRSEHLRGLSIDAEWGIVDFDEWEGYSDRYSEIGKVLKELKPMYNDELDSDEQSDEFKRLANELAGLADEIINDEWANPQEQNITTWAKVKVKTAARLAR